MHLIINGQNYPDLQEGMSVSQLLEHLKLPAKKVAIECNLEIVPKSTFDERRLGDGDRLEIIHFIGGG